MGYSGARGGIDAIEAAEKLVRRKRLNADCEWVSPQQIVGRFRLAVDRVMGEAGITLGNATVSSGAGQQAADQRAGSSDGNRGGSGRGGVAGDDGAEVARTVTTRRLPSGAVDTFA